MGLYSLAAGGLSTLKASTGVESREPQNRSQQGLDPWPRAAATPRERVFYDGDRRKPIGGETWARPGTRRTAATFLGRSWGSGGRCQFGGICARVT